MESRDKTETRVHKGKRHRVISAGKKEGYEWAGADLNRRHTDSQSGWRVRTATFPVNIAGGGVFDATDNWFTGQIDEIYVYQRALSPAEVAGLAGETTPMHKPF